MAGRPCLASSTAGRSSSSEAGCRDCQSQVAGSVGDEFHARTVGGANPLERHRLLQQRAGRRVAPSPVHPRLSPKGDVALRHRQRFCSVEAQARGHCCSDRACWRRARRSPMKPKGPLLRRRLILRFALLRPLCFRTAACVSPRPLGGPGPTASSLCPLDSPNELRLRLTSTPLCRPVVAPWCTTDAGCQ